MAVTGRIEMTGSPRQLAKARRGAVKHANIETVVYWHRRFMPSHFQTGAQQRYGYRARTKAYLRRKRRLKGHTRPLVYSGRTERVAKRSIRVSGTSKRATGRINAPALNYRQLQDELIRTIARERKSMEQVHERLITKRLNRVQTRTVRRV